MFGKRITLFKLLGFEVHIDLSWLVIAVLITWSLAKGLFPYHVENLSALTYWLMGIAGAIGLFFSIVFHELFHSLAARRFGLPMKGITLFIFGGVAEMDDEPPSPKAEFYMAIAGPISSIVIGFGFYVAFLLSRASALPVPVVGVLGYLGFINWILAVFNLLPAFPLDGGRVLRSGLWKWKNNIRWATRIASQIGSGFGIAIIVIGVLNILTGNVIGGIWWFLIGMFLRGASQASYQQVLMRGALAGATVERFMKRDPVTVQPSIPIGDLVDQYVYHYHYKMFPVVDRERLVGCVNTKQIKEIPREQWSSKTVGQIASRCARENTISPDTDAMKALALMNKTGNSRLMVVRNDRLVGLITLKDIIGYLAVKLDLGEDTQ